MAKKDPSLSNLFLSLGLIMTSIGYASWLNINNTQAAGTASTSIATNITVPPIESTPSSSTTPILASTSPTSTPEKTKLVTTPKTTPAQQPPTPMPIVQKPKGQYIDGTYTGTQADAYYGYIQVQAIVQNGKLADVQFLQYPNDRRTSQEINSQAMPMLRTEALQVQSANVDTISGASDTSAAFIESLGAALAQAAS